MGFEVGINEKLDFTLRCSDTALLLFSLPYLPQNVCSVTGVDSNSESHCLNCV